MRSVRGRIAAFVKKLRREPGLGIVSGNAAGRPFRTELGLLSSTECLEVTLKQVKGVESTKAAVAVIRKINSQPIDRASIGDGWSYSQSLKGMYAYVGGVDDGGVLSLPRIERKWPVHEVTIEFAPWSAKGLNMSDIASGIATKALVAGVEGLDWSVQEFGWEAH